MKRNVIYLLYFSVHFPLYSEWSEAFSTNSSIVIMNTNIEIYTRKPHRAKFNSLKYFFETIYILHIQFIFWAVAVVCVSAIQK